MTNTDTETQALLKPKPISLPNREALIRSIALVGKEAINVKMRQDDLNLKEKYHEDPTQAVLQRDDAWFAYRKAMEQLETERLVSGEHFRAIIDKLISFIDYHIDNCMGLMRRESKPETLKTVPFMTELNERIDQTIRELDETV